MADYEITIVLPEESSATGPVSNSSTEEQDDSTSTKSYMAKSAESAKSAAKNIATIGSAAALADKLISYDISTVSLRTGATEYEQKLQFAYSTVKQYAVPIIAGAVTGGLPGAIIGGLFSLGMQITTWAQNQQTIEYKRQLENISIGMASVRAGVTGSRTNNQ